MPRAARLSHRDGRPSGRPGGDKRAVIPSQRGGARARSWNPSRWRCKDCSLDIFRPDCHATARRRV
ncbi:hypothetical protein BU14_1114s0001 [Porphyra umbilicalis]|uniref:Uncharacterized protein n=1 Tax=Porphyra umbilicalis TaxID=2786 RepID=A0A1X6NMV8_PORUM|nr:hypothetical protein BU14_1114s0001 [Porphyra umbilicalis]|eukprot:OSX69816.1 hypothetical protein BU14_1114s0001 [Porphyra umbilicalis]